MKKILFIMASLFALNMNAQVEPKQKAETVNFGKGSTFVTGDFKFNDNNATQVSALETNVSVNRFVTNNVALGVDLGIESTKFVANSYLVGVKGRRYFNPSNQFSTFLQLEGKADINAKSDLVNYNANFGGGVNYFVSKHFAIEASLGALNYDWDNRTDDTKFNADLNLKDVKIGLVYKF